MDAEPASRLPIPERFSPPMDYPIYRAFTSKRPSLFGTDINGVGICPEKMAKFDAEILGPASTLEAALERPRAFGDKIGAGKTRPTKAQEFYGPGGLLERSAKEFHRQWSEARAKDLVYAAEYGCMFYERRWAFTFAQPARVVSIVGWDYEAFLPKPKTVYLKDPFFPRWWPLDVKDRQKRLGEYAATGQTVFTPGMNAPIIITDYGIPATVADITGPGISV